MRSGTWGLVSGVWSLGTALVGGFAASAGPVAAQETHVLIVSGIGGEAQYTAAFHEWGGKLYAAAVEGGIPAANVTWLAEDPSRNAARIGARSTKEAVTAAVRALGERAGGKDQALVVLIGHGSYAGAESRLNLPGPDITAVEFAALLDGVKAERVGVVVAASASGEWGKALASPGRAVATATKSGMERNESVFGRFFADAYSGAGADSDKDGRVSLAEAFAYAEREVARFYESDNRLMTEHAVLTAPELAAALYLGAAVGAPADASPELRALHARRTELEGEVAALRARRDSMERAAYEAELERLIVELATVSRRIRELEGGP